MCIEIRGVAMVVARLFEIDAIGLHLLRQLFEEYLLSRPTPAPCFFELRQERPEIKQPKRFAGQVRVGAEVSREICFQMTRVEIEKLDSADENLGG